MDDPGYTPESRQLSTGALVETKWYADQGHRIIWLVVGLALFAAGAIGTAVSMQGNNPGILFYGAILGGLYIAAKAFYGIVQSNVSGRRIMQQVETADSAYAHLKASNPAIDENFTIFGSAPNGSDDLMQAILTLTRIDAELAPPGANAFHGTSSAWSRFRSNFLMAHGDRLKVFGGTQPKNGFLAPYMNGDSEDIRAYAFADFEISP